MKKHLILLAVCGLLFTLPAFAAGETQPAQYNLWTEPAENVDVPVDESTYREETPAPYVPVEREPGRGTLEDICQYWEDNGYPEDVSYAFASGGEVIDGTVYTYWEIGLVNAGEERKEEILNLVAPTGLVTFYNCTYTHAQKVEAYEALLALNDENIQVIFVRNTENVVAAVPEDQEKEYAQLLIRDLGLGAVVSVVGSTSIMEDLTQAVPGLGVDGAGLLPDDSAQKGTGRWGIPDSEREAWFGDGPPVPAPERSEPAWAVQPLWLAGGLAAGGILLLLVRQARSAAVQTAAGPIDASLVSRRQVMEAVRDCAEAPRPEVYQSILEQLSKR